MQRSLFTAISGLTNHQSKLDVIGNNIANVNTTAFKAGSVRFADILNQTIRGASAPQENRGGVNPMQVGMGMQLAAIDMNHTQGNLQNTGRALDMAIEGSGFFLVSDGAETYFTRDGSFSRGSDGYLLNTITGFRVMGWPVGADGSIDTSRPLEGLEIPLGFRAEARATENLTFGGNLDASAAMASTYELEADIYDSLGESHTMRITFTKSGVNQWGWVANVVDGATLYGTGSGTITFNERGTVTAGSAGAFTLPAGPPIAGANPLSIDLDFTTLSQLVGQADALLRDQDGFSMGTLSDFTVSGTGVITGTYTNGMVSPIGQIALGRFENPGGLMSVGSNMFRTTANSGDVYIGTPNSQGRGRIQTSSLEMSNVNIAFEFTEIITTSRAFQANSRVITSSDELLQEVVNLKR